MDELYTRLAPFRRRTPVERSIPNLGFDVMNRANASEVRLPRAASCMKSMLSSPPGCRVGGYSSRITQSAHCLRGLVCSGRQTADVSWATNTYACCSQTVTWAVPVATTMPERRRRDDVAAMSTERPRMSSPERLYKPLSSPQVLGLFPSSINSSSQVQSVFGLNFFCAFRSNRALRHSSLDQTHLLDK